MLLNSKNIKGLINNMCNCMASTNWFSATLNILDRILTNTPAIKFKKIMVLNVLRKISEDFHSSPYFSLMVTDTSNREQVVICLPRVDNSFKPHEEFIGLYKVDETSANSILLMLSVMCF